MNNFGGEGPYREFEPWDYTVPLAIQKAIGMVSGIKLGKHGLSRAWRHPGQDGLRSDRVNASGTLGPGGYGRPPPGQSQNRYETKAIPPTFPRPRHRSVALSPRSWNSGRRVQVNDVNPIARDIFSSPTPQTTAGTKSSTFSVSKTMRMVFLSL